MPLYLYSPISHFGEDLDDLFAPATFLVRPTTDSKTTTTKKKQSSSTAITPSPNHDKQGAATPASPKQESEQQHQQKQVHWENEIDNNHRHDALWHALFQQQQNQTGVQFHEDDKSYSVSIDLPGVKASDMSLKLEDDHDGKTVVHLSGHRKLRSSDGSHISESKFSKRFTIGKNVDIDKLSANLCDGVLTLTAPKKAPPAAVVREIKITQSN